MTDKEEGKSDSGTSVTLHTDSPALKGMRSRDNLSKENLRLREKIHSLTAELEQVWSLLDRHFDWVAGTREQEGYLLQEASELKDNSVLKE